MEKYVNAPEAHLFIIFKLFCIFQNDGRGDGRTIFQSGTMDQQRFVSMKPVDNSNKYILGYIKDKEAHTSLVRNIFQLRPSFSYFDKSDKRNKAEQKAENEADNDEEEAKQITVKFARTENDRLRKAREKSYVYMSKKIAEEPWCQTFYCDINTTDAAIERQKLFSASHGMTGHALSLPSNEYIESLIPAENQHCSLEPRVICMNKLRTMPLNSQIHHILKDVKAISFKQILKLLSDKDFSSKQILQALQSEGVLVNGNWVVQSEKLYPPESVSKTNGVSAELMCRARDYILYLLHRNEQIDRRNISNVTQIPVEEVTELLLTVAHRQNEKWQLLLPPCTELEEEHQEVIQRQEAHYRAKESMYLEWQKMAEAEDKSPKRKRKISERSKL